MPKTAARWQRNLPVVLKLVLDGKIRRRRRLVSYLSEIKVWNLEFELSPGYLPKWFLIMQHSVRNAFWVYNFGLKVVSGPGRIHKASASVSNFVTRPPPWIITPINIAFTLLLLKPSNFGHRNRRRLT